MSYGGKSVTEVRMGTSQRKDYSRAETPGPGAYEMGKDAKKGVTISGYKGKQAIEVTPGPGAY